MAANDVITLSVPDNRRTLDSIATFASYAEAVRLTPGDHSDEAMEKLCVREALSRAVSYVEGDITMMDVDAIVSSFHPFEAASGVQQAVENATGSNFAEDEKLRVLKVGEVAIFPAPNMHARNIMFTRPPIEVKAEELARCYTAVLDLCLARGLKTVVFPCIGTGFSDYPPDQAAEIACRAVAEWLGEGDRHRNFDRVIFCIHRIRDRKLYHDAMRDLFLPIYTIRPTGHRGGGVPHMRKGGGPTPPGPEVFDEVMPDPSMP